MRYHGIVINCPDCHQATDIVAVNIKADGSLRLDLNCPACAKDCAWTSTAMNLAQCAMKLDQNEVPDHVTEYDLRFMQAVHFKMDDTKLLTGGDSQSN